jgi:hypothetical protein
MKTIGIIKTVCDAITADAESSRRHWAEVRAMASARIPGSKASAWPRWEHRVAVAALALIDRTGRFDADELMPHSGTITQEDRP